MLYNFFNKINLMVFLFKSKIEIMSINFDKILKCFKSISITVTNLE